MAVTQTISAHGRRFRSVVPGHWPPEPNISPSPASRHPAPSSNVVSDTRGCVAANGTALFLGAHGSRSSSRSRPDHHPEGHMKASVFIATSLDGFIARPDGALDWLPVDGGEPHGYNEFIATVDALVIGRKTLETVLSFDAWPYGTKPVVVLSTTLSG